MILEPQKFTSNYIVAPKFDRRTKVGKQDYEDFLLQTEGKTLLFEDESRFRICCNVSFGNEMSSSSSLLAREAIKAKIKNIIPK